MRRALTASAAVHPPYHAEHHQQKGMVNTMKRKQWAAALLSLLCLLALSAPAMAAESTPVTAHIPVSTAVTGTAPAEAEVYTVTLTALDEGAPMPEKDTLTLTGAETGEFSVSSAEPGIYHYELRQSAGQNPLATYDGAVWQVTVSFYNREQGGLDAAVAVYPNGGDKKEDAVVFTNNYAAPKQPEQPAATNPPQKLIQTGQLNWPVPVLGGLGLAFAALGGVLICKGRKRDEP